MGPLENFFLFFQAFEYFLCFLKVFPGFLIWYFERPRPVYPTFLAPSIWPVSPRLSGLSRRSRPDFSRPVMAFLAPFVWPFSPRLSGLSRRSRPDSLTLLGLFVWPFSPRLSDLSRPVCVAFLAPFEWPFSPRLSGLSRPVCPTFLAPFVWPFSPRLSGLSRPVCVAFLAPFVQPFSPRLSGLSCPVCQGPLGSLRGAFLSAGPRFLVRSSGGKMLLGAKLVAVAGPYICGPGGGMGGYAHLLRMGRCVWKFHETRGGPLRYENRVHDPRF